MRRHTVIDISVCISPSLPVWPGSPGAALTPRMSLARGDEANVTQLDLDVHCGTHVDAPLHFVSEGESIGEIGLAPLIGPAVVVEVKDSQVIDASALEGASIPTGTERLLLRTRNSDDPEFRTWPFRPDYAALSLDAAYWLVEAGVRLVGIDYLSIQLFHDPPDTHRVILGAGICILENLALSHVAPGTYDLMCLPLSLAGAEAAPARAVLLQEGTL